VTAASGARSATRWSSARGSRSGARPRQRRASSTARAWKPPKVEDLAATTPARRWRAASATSWPTPSACSAASSFTPPTFRTATARRTCWTRSAPAGRGCATSSPTAVTPATSCRPRLGRRADLRVARALPQARQGLGENHRLRDRLPPCRPHPPPHPPHRKALRRL